MQQVVRDSAEYRSPKDLRAVFVTLEVKMKMVEEARGKGAQDLGMPEHRRRYISAAAIALTRITVPCAFIILTGMYGADRTEHTRHEIRTPPAPPAVWSVLLTAQSHQSQAEQPSAQSRGRAAHSDTCASLAKLGSPMAVYATAFITVLSGARDARNLPVSSLGGSNSASSSGSCASAGTRLRTRGNDSEGV
jgi:hypothetical protein